MISVKDQENLLVEVSRKLTRKMTAIAIGGTAMMFFGYKDSTMDIDLVFTNENDRREFSDAAISLGYSSMDSCIIYDIKENRPFMLKRLDNRFDLFLRDVIHFKFSKDMEKRVKQNHEFGENLTIKIADFHDIILMKCATDRAKDREDIISIINKERIDWDIIIKEAKNQIGLGKKRSVFEINYTLSEIKKESSVKIPKYVFERIWSMM